MPRKTTSCCCAQKQQSFPGGRLALRLSFQGHGSHFSPKPLPKFQDCLPYDSKARDQLFPAQRHRARLRQRLEREPLAVADYEVLELLLGYGLTRKDTKPLAKNCCGVSAAFGAYWMRGRTNYCRFRASGRGS